jgi:hypothetical protein
MATKPKAGFTKKSQSERESTKKSADQRENERIRAIAERPMLGDPKSDIRNTDYWMCKPKELTNV